jgi:hypothetical protein
MVDRNFLFLAAFLFEADQRSFSSLKIVVNPQIHDRSDPGKRISQRSKKCFVQKADDVTRVDRLEHFLDFFRTERRRLAFGPREFVRAGCSMSERGRNFRKHPGSIKLNLPVGPLWLARR